MVVAASSGSRPVAVGPGKPTTDSGGKSEGSAAADVNVSARDVLIDDEEVWETLLPVGGNISAVADPA